MKYTAEEELYIIENARNRTSNELAEMLNTKFGTNRTPSQVLEKCNKRLGIRLKNKTRFGERERTQLPIGTMRTTVTGIYIKVKEVPIGTCISGYQRPYWIPIQEKVYTDKYGKLPNGYMVCFLDGNRENIKIENLYAINRKISSVMAKNKWWTESREVTLTAIKWCELFYAKRDVI